MKCRVAIIEDSLEIKKLLEVTWEEYHKKINELFLSHLMPSVETIKKRIDMGMYIVAESEGKIVGLIRGGVEFGGVAKISMLCVSLEYRGKGIGQCLFDNFISTLNNIHKIYLYTHQDLIEAINFYKKNNFNIICSLKNFWEKEDFLMMERINS